MNPLRKKSAINTYGPMIADKAIADIKALIEGDARAYKADEVDEILEAVLAYDPAANPPKPGAAITNTPPAGQNGSENNAAAADEKTTLNKKYEEWSVESKWENHPAGQGKQAWREHKGYTRIKLIRTTSITPERAETLNGQSESTAIRLYTVEDIAAGKDK